MFGIFVGEVSLLKTFRGVDFENGSQEVIFYTKLRAKTEFKTRSTREASGVVHIYHKTLLSHGLFDEWWRELEGEMFIARGC